MKSKISNPVGEGFIPSRITRQPVGEGEGRPQGSPLQVPSRYPRRQSTRLKDFDYAQAGAVFFITLCSLGKKQIFVKNDFNTEIIECVKNEQKRVGHAIYVFCLMPEHFHLLLSPLETGIPVTQFMGGLSSRITRLSWGYGFSGRLFQRSFYDHVVRKQEDLMRVAEYILNNPVRRGLVGAWQDYRYCGFIDPLPLQGRPFLASRMRTIVRETLVVSRSSVVVGAGLVPARKVGGDKPLPYKNTKKHLTSLLFMV